MRTARLAKRGRQRPSAGSANRPAAPVICLGRIATRGDRLIVAEPVGFQHQHVDLVLGGEPEKGDSPIVRASSAAGCFSSDESTAPASPSIRQLPASSAFDVLELLTGKPTASAQVSNQSGVPSGQPCCSSCPCPKGSADPDRRPIRARTTLPRPIRRNQLGKQRALAPRRRQLDRAVFHRHRLAPSLAKGPESHRPARLAIIAADRKRRPSGRFGQRRPATRRPATPPHSSAQQRNCHNATGDVMSVAGLHKRPLLRRDYRACVDPESPRRWHRR